LSGQDTCPAGDDLTLARLISLVERDSAQVPEIMKSLSARTGRAYRIGITGPPGAGKSTLINGLTTLLRERSFSVAVLAVDPTSPFKGGAILGDRVRMQKHYTDEGVFIRSLATRGVKGGLTGAISEIIDLVDAAGKDYILLETVGVGQSELDIVGHVDTLAVVLVPGTGDSIQTMKAGIMEIADIFVVNKSDLAGVDELVNNLTMAIDPAKKEQGWQIPVLKCRADSNEGVKELLDQILLHRQLLESSGLLEERRGRQRLQQFRMMLEQKILEDIRSKILAEDRIKQIGEKIESGEISPYAALSRVLETVLPSIYERKTLNSSQRRSKK
jgi:LAO/AO transport system kinase